MPIDVDEDLRDHDHHHHEHVEVPVRHGPEHGHGLVRREAHDAGDGAHDVNRRGDVNAGGDGDLPDHVEPRRRPRPGPAAEPKGPEVEPTRGRICRCQLRHRGRYAQREEAHDRPADRIDDRPGELEPVSVQQDGAGQNGDDGEGDGEIGESAHLAEQLLGISQPVELLDVLLDQLLASRRTRGHG